MDVNNNKWGYKMDESPKRGNLKDVISQSLKIPLIKQKSSRDPINHNK